MGQLSVRCHNFLPATGVRQLLEGGREEGGSPRAPPSGGALEGGRSDGHLVLLIFHILEGGRAQLPELSRAAVRSHVKFKGFGREGGDGDISGGVVGCIDGAGGGGREEGRPGIERGGRQQGCGGGVWRDGLVDPAGAGAL